MPITARSVYRNPFFNWWIVFLCVNTDTSRTLKSVQGPWGQSGVKLYRNGESFRCLVEVAFRLIFQRIYPSRCHSVTMSWWSCYYLNPPTRIWKIKGVNGKGNYCFPTFYDIMRMSFFHMFDKRLPLLVENDFISWTELSYFECIVLH